MGNFRATLPSGLRATLPWTALGSAPRPTLRSSFDGTGVVDLESAELDADIDEDEAPPALQRGGGRRACRAQGGTPIVRTRLAAR